MYFNKKVYRNVQMCILIKIYSFIVHRVCMSGMGGN